MSIPGFTAEASIGPTTQVYRVHDHYGTAMASGLYPQLSGEDMDFNDEAMAMTEDIVEADSEEGLGDQEIVATAEHVAVADDDEVHVDV
jgi:hypothetical protein